MKRPPQPTVLLSAFGDEAAVGKTAVEQLGVMSALGLCHYSVRFVDLGGGVVHVAEMRVAVFALQSDLDRDRFEIGRSEG